MRHLFLLKWMRSVSDVILTEERVDSQDGACGLCGEQSGKRASFIQVLLFPLPIFIPPAAPFLSAII
jgi:hypothetical protein